MNSFSNHGYNSKTYPLAAARAEAAKATMRILDCIFEVFVVEALTKVC